MKLPGSNICLVGAGNMGGAMLAGWMEGGMDAGKITVIDPGPRADMAARLDGWGIPALSRPPEGYKPDVLVIAVKPQMMAAILPGLSQLVGSNTVSVSVAAGTTLATLSGELGGAVVRAMPNTPALLRCGITVCCAKEAVTPAQRHTVTGLLEAIGKVEWVDKEAEINAVTAVSGSGPAYVFHLAECMAAAGVAEGLTPELADKLARETIAGAGEMLAKLDEQAAKLRQNVTSPNGTTAAALAVLMAKPGLSELMAKAIAAAKKRSEELSND